MLDFLPSLLESALGDTMDRLSQHTSSEPVPSLPRDEDQDYLDPSLDQDLDHDHEAEDQQLESHSTPSRMVELKVLCTQRQLTITSIWFISSFGYTES